MRTDPYIKSYQCRSMPALNPYDSSDKRKPVHLYGFMRQLTLQKTFTYHLQSSETQRLPFTFPSHILPKKERSESPSLTPKAEGQARHSFDCVHLRQPKLSSPSPAPSQLASSPSTKPKESSNSILPKAIPGASTKIRAIPYELRQPERSDAKKKAIFMGRR